MSYFLHKAFWDHPQMVLVFFSTLLAIIFVRYLLLASLYQVVLQRFREGTLDIFKFKRIQIRREIKWAFFSSLVFTAICAVCLYAYHQGWTKTYLEVGAYSLWYFLTSGIVVILLYETYYYWLHRAMHIPAIFRIVHKVHHESIHPTVFTSFCFHPLEALLQFIFFPVLLLFMPVHYIVLLTVLMLFTVSALINHSGVEVFHKRFLLKHLIGSSHHDLHHKEFKTNFGLYFTWWDKWMRTESK
jgi:lathosterol oxidase